MADRHLSTVPPDPAEQATPTPVTGPALAADIRAGDVLVIDGSQFLVVAEPEYGHFYRDGRPAYGVRITCRAGTARLFLDRLANELLPRVRRAE